MKNMKNTLWHRHYSVCVIERTAGDRRGDDHATKGAERSLQNLFK
jgi:hypothetical protein